MMKKIFSILLAFLFVCIVFVTITSAGDLEVNLLCPSYVNAGSNIKVTVYLENNNDYPITVKRYMAGLVIRTGNTLALQDTSVYGPIPNALSAPITVPAHGTVPPFNATIMKAPPVPNSTIGVVGIEFIPTTGDKLIGGGGCMVLIKP